MELKVLIIPKGKIFDKNGPEVINRELIGVMYEATSFLEREVKERTPHRTGHLARTIHAEVIEKGMPLIKGIVGHQAKYGDLVEKGTGIYGPRGQAFEIRPREKKALFWVGALHPVAKVVQKGFPGRFMFRRTLQESWPKIMKMFHDAGFKIAKGLSE